jgi:hypothetical protein
MLLTIDGGLVLMCELPWPGRSREPRILGHEGEIEERFADGSVWWTHGNR